MNRVWTKLAGVFVFLLAASGGASARAAPPLSWVASQKPTSQAPSRAENLVQRALALMQQKKWGRAARLLETSNQLDPGIGAHAHLAECYEALGHMALAWTTFSAAADHASREGHADREKAARGRAASLEPWIVLIILNVPPDVSRLKGLRIMVDGQDIDDQKWADGGAPVLAVEPGHHVLAATAPGKRPWQQTVSVGALGSRVRVDVPPTVAVAQASAGSSWNAERKAAIAAGSTGAIAVGTGISGLVLISQDRSPAAVPMAATGLILGVPSVITAIVFGVGSSRRGRAANPPAARWQIGPTVGPKGAALVVTGQF